MSTRYLEITFPSPDWLWENNFDLTRMLTHKQDGDQNHSPRDKPRGAISITLLLNGAHFAPSNQSYDM